MGQGSQNTFWSEVVGHIFVLDRFECSQSQSISFTDLNSMNAIESWRLFQKFPASVDVTDADSANCFDASVSSSCEPSTFHAEGNLAMPTPSVITVGCHPKIQITSDPSDSHGHSKASFTFAPSHRLVTSKRTRTNQRLRSITMKLSISKLHNDLIRRFK